MPLPRKCCCAPPRRKDRLHSIDHRQVGDYCIQYTFFRHPVTSRSLEMSHPWSGVFPAVTTNRSRSGVRVLPAMRESLGRLIANGVSGAVLLPMLGENASLTLAEREAVIRTASEVVDGRIPLLSGLAETTLGTATANAQLYRSWGAQGLMVFPSLGYKSDPRETAQWYRELAAAAALPILIYNNPIPYGVAVTPAVPQALAALPELASDPKETADIPRLTDIPAD